MIEIPAGVGINRLAGFDDEGCACIVRCNDAEIGFRAQDKPDPA